MSLRLDWVGHDAAKYAVEHWHYSKCMPMGKLNHVGVWEDKEFKGVVIFGYGATADLLSPYGLTMYQGCELVRVALTRHSTPVSRILKIAIKLLKEKNPELKLIVSFADPSEGHHGGIYQATNWIYTGDSAGCNFYRDKNGKLWHPRRVSPDPNNRQKYIKTYDCEKVWRAGKHRYLYPLTDDMRLKIEPLRKPYPKKSALVVHPVRTPGDQPGEGGSIPTPTHMHENQDTFPDREMRLIADNSGA